MNLLDTSDDLDWLTKNSFKLQDRPGNGLVSISAHSDVTTSYTVLPSNIDEHVEQIVGPSADDIIDPLGQMRYVIPSDINELLIRKWQFLVNNQKIAIFNWHEI
jgi:hypothetical protein